MKALLCSWRKRRINALVDGELGRSAARRLEAHLACCPRCRAYRDGISGLGEALRDATVSPVPGAAEAFAGRLSRALPPRRPTGRSAAPHRTRLAPAGILIPAGAVALLLLTVIALRWDRGPVAPVAELAMRADVVPSASVFDRTILAQQVDRSRTALLRASLVLVQVSNLTPEDARALAIVQQEIRLLGLIEELDELASSNRVANPAASTDLFAPLAGIMIDINNAGPASLPGIVSSINRSGIVERIGDALTDLREIADWTMAAKA